MRALRWIAALAVLAAGAAWIVTGASAVPAAYDTLVGDAERGRVTFAIAGCASCHTAPDADADGAPVLAGGQRFVSEFGTFVAPNISPSPQGVGDWTDAEMIHAIRDGVSPDHRHYYPALPYTAYHKADPQDLADIAAYLRTLPPSDAANAPHEMDFPFGIRRAVGAWKILYLSDGYVLEDAPDPEVARGRYLVEALGHCAECHTPRTALGGLDSAQWLAGAPNPSGEGRIPNITPGGLSWSRADIEAYLETGFTPDFDTAGGEMTAVIKNTAQLPPEDRAAISAYLKAIPPVE